jgi:hypothetical protein
VDWGSQATEVGWYGHCGCQNYKVPQRARRTAHLAADELPLLTRGESLASDKEACGPVHGLGRGWWTRPHGQAGSGMIIYVFPFLKKIFRRRLGFGGGGEPPESEFLNKLPNPGILVSQDLRWNFEILKLCSKHFKIFFTCAGWLRY